MYKDKKEKIVATIEARMTSTRLPGKVLMPLVGKPVLSHLIERLQRSVHLDEICVATTTNAQDDAIEELARSLGVACFRGSESDVLGRVVAAARSVEADIIVEITGDCPATDPRLIDQGIETFFESGADYVANNLEPTFPRGGFEVQVFKTSTLEEVASLTTDPIDRTHVSYYIYQHPEQYRLKNFAASPMATAPQLRVVLDEPADYALITRVFEHLYPHKPDFTVEDVVQYLLQNPDVAQINSAVVGKAAHEL